MNAAALTGETIDAARRFVSRVFRDAQIDTPELDARLLAGAALALDLTGLGVQALRRLTPDEAGRLAAFAARRLGGEPVARIVGRKEFWSLDFALSPATLTPRPDTETLVDAALALYAGRTPPRCFADIGTGCGAILLALLSSWPDPYGIGVDVDVAALRTARDNAAALQLAHRAAFVASDYGAALRHPLDLIVSNPPYIASAVIATLAREVRDHEPRRALDGGPDGLAGYRRLCDDAARLLARDGVLAVEVGRGQADDVARLMTAAGIAVILPHRTDLAGIQRVVAGRLSNA